MKKGRDRVGKERVHNKTVLGHLQYQIKSYYMNKFAIEESNRKEFINCKGIEASNGLMSGIQL